MNEYLVNLSHGKTLWVKADYISSGPYLEFYTNNPTDAGTVTRELTAAVADWISVEKVEKADDYG